MYGVNDLDIGPCRQFSEGIGYVAETLAEALAPMSGNEDQFFEGSRAGQSRWKAARR